MNAHASTRRFPLDSPVTYRLEVAGHLDDHWSDWLGDVALVHNDDATTTVTLAVADQAQLHGLLSGLAQPLVKMNGLSAMKRTAPVSR